MSSKSRSSRANPSRFIRGRKIPFLRSKGEREGRREEQASSKDSPLWKWQARRVNIWQPPSELPLISSLFSISPRRNIGHGSTPSTTLPFQPAQTLSPREHLPRGEKLLVRGITRFRVSFVFGWNDLVSFANNCNFHPPNGGEDGKLWIRVVGSLQVFESFRKVSILRIAKIILRN